jgi:uncharacterized protein YndB with AHSA1/START domain
MADNRSIRHEVRVACPVDRAFAVFTARIDGWWPVSHRTVPGSVMALEAGLGGRVFERGPDGVDSPLGSVLAWDPPHALSFSWRLGAPPGRFTRVDVRFVPEGARTRVEVVHTEGDSGLGTQWPDRARRFAENWSQVLAALLQWTEDDGTGEGR